MYIIYATVLILMIVLFSSTIMAMIKTYTNPVNTTTKSIVGSVWFVGLLILNILVITFIYSFYYYKSTTAGKQGNTGSTGFSGLSGDACIIATPNSQYYAAYNPM